MNMPRVARPSVLSLNISSKSALYSYYMPFIKGGGLFFPTPKACKLGDELFLLLQLPDEATKHPVAGSVVWITPANAQGGRPQGVGVRFSEDEAGAAVRGRIEQILGGHLSSNRPTSTI